MELRECAMRRAVPALATVVSVIVIAMFGLAQAATPQAQTGIIPADDPKRSEPDRHGNGNEYANQHGRAAHIPADTLSSDADA
jgi:hypothetical protein